MQLERVKLELKRRFYDQNKFSGKTINSIIFYLGFEGAPVSHGETSPERSKMRWELNETAMDSRKRIYHGVENDEGCLRWWWPASRRDGLAGKACRRVRRNASYWWRTLARSGGSYKRRLVIRVVLLKPGRRGLRRHIYSRRVWKLFGFS
jgi:hypothetical protein